MKKAEEIGLIFKNARESRGVSLAQAAEALRIRRVYLHALEDGRWHELPGKVYVTGYVKSYASYLNLHEYEDFKLNEDEKKGPKKLASAQFSNLKLILITFASLLLLLILLLYYKSYSTAHAVEEYLQEQPDFLDFKLPLEEQEIIGPDLEHTTQILNLKN